MWMTALRDLQWRRRRFLIAVIGTSLVFGMTLVLAGLATSFDREATRTLAVHRGKGGLVTGVDPLSNRSLLDAADDDA